MTDKRAQPLVSIGIPTFNRVGPLARAVESALYQTYAPIEIIISDNASTDGTAAYCLRLTEQEERVSYVRLHDNVGALGNFERVLRSAQGHYFMWLGDDDWIDTDYVAQCVASLESDGFLQLVSGVAKYYSGSEQILTGEMLEIDDQDPSRRVARFYREVRLNGIIYGVARRAVLSQLLPLHHSFGRDWMMSAAIASRGGLSTLHTTTLHRTVGGMSSDPDLLRQVGLGSVAARFPYSTMLADMCTDILSSAMYAELRPRRRQSLALVCAAIFVRRISRLKAGGYRQRMRCFKGKTVAACGRYRHRLPHRP